MIWFYLKSWQRSYLIVRISNPTIIESNRFRRQGRTRHERFLRWIIFTVHCPFVGYTFPARVQQCCNFSLTTFQPRSAHWRYQSILLTLHIIREKFVSLISYLIFFPNNCTNGRPIESKFSEANKKACSTHLAATSIECCEKRSWYVLTTTLIEYHQSIQLERTSRSFEKFDLLAPVWSSFRRIPGGESARLPSKRVLPNTFANFLMKKERKAQWKTWSISTWVIIWSTNVTSY